MEPMRIRPEQYEGLRRQAMADFEARAVAHLRRKLAEPTAGLSDRQLVERVRACVPRAAEYGLTTERQIICFVDATYFLGEGFDTDPRYGEIAEVLCRRDADPDERAGLTVGMAYGRYYLASRDR